MQRQRQQQRKRHKHEGAESFVQATAPSTPVSSAPCETGVVDECGTSRRRSRRRALRPCGGERRGGGVQLKVAILGEYSVIIISSSVDRGSLSLLSWSLCRPSARVQQVMGCWMVQTRLPASHRWPASPPFSSSRDHQHKKGGVEGGRRPLLRRPRIALPAQKKERTPPHTISHKPNLNGVEGQRTSCRKYYLVEDHCGPCPHTHRGSPWRAGRCGTEKIGTTPPCWVV